MTNAHQPPLVALNGENVFHNLGSRWAGRPRNDSLVTIAGNAAYAASQFGILVVLAKLTSTADVGRYALALAITAPIQIGLGMRLRTARVINDPAEYTLRSYTSLALVTAAGAAAVSSAIGFLVIQDERTRLAVLLVAVSKSIESLIDLSYGDEQRRQEMATIAKSQFLRAALSLAAASFGAWIDRGIIGALIGISVVWAGQLAVLDGRRLHALSRLEASRSAYRRPTLSLARRTWPLGLAAAITSFNGMAPQYVIAGLLSTRELGVFAILAYPTTAMSLVANSLGQAKLSAMGDAFRNRDLSGLRRIARRMSTAILALGTMIVVVLFFSGKEILTVVFGSEYGNYVGVSILLVVTATTAGLATVSYYTLTSTGRFTHQPRVAALSSLLGIPAVWLMTREYGLAGTALGMMFMLGGQWALSAFVSRRELLRALGTEGDIT